MSNIKDGINNQSSFSFIEFNNLLTKQYSSIENIQEQDNLLNSNNEQKLKFEPNSNVARIPISEQTNQLIKDKSEKKTDIIQDIAKTFQGEQSLILKKEKSQNKKEQNKVHNDNLMVVKDDSIKEKPKKKIPKEQQSIETFIHEMQKNDPKAYVPITLPFEQEEPNNVTCKDEITVNDTNGGNKGNTQLNEGKLFVFQFPRQIPINLDIQEKEKKEEIINEEPTYDSNGFLVKDEFKNVFKELPKNKKIGKLKIYKSGKVKIDINGILFDVIPGINNNFIQQASIITKEQSNQCYILGNINSKNLIVIPEFN